MTTTESCAECGTRAEPGQSFCDACGAVLSWTDRAGAGREKEAEPAEGRAAEKSASAARAGSGVVRGPGAGAAVSAGTERTAAGADETAPGGAVAPAGEGGSAGAAFAGAPRTADGPAGPKPDANAEAPAAAPASMEDDDTAEIERVPAMPDVRGPSAPGPAPADDGMDRARQLLVPVADPEARPAAPSIAPVLPGRPVPQRPQVVRAPGEELGADGGIPCPWCATPNRTDRHFCVRCAMPMTKLEQVGVQRPWWRRMLDFRNRETPWAGDRPRLHRTFDRVLSWLGAAIVLTLLIVLAFNVPRAVQATKDHFAKPTPIAPDSVSASRSYPGHPAGRAFDKWNNTWWGPGVSETGQGQWIEATFDQPTRLLDLDITSGVSTHPTQLQQEALPHRLTATVTTDKGTTFTREITLDQISGAQTIPFRVGTVTRVRFTIESAYFASTTKQVAIAEIEFFGPSSRS